jgi:biopolymer transport protein ExbB
MKKILAFLTVVGILSFGLSKSVMAQDAATQAAQTAGQVVKVAADTVVAALATTEQASPKLSMHQQIKAKFIEGGAGFMASILFCFIFGLAIAIERIIYLNLATTNTNKLLTKIEDALESGGVEAAKEVCRNTRGPVASIFYQGLDRIDQGLDIVEKSILSYGSVQMGLLERNLSWISLFIALAPMLGFMGTVIGMIMAFAAITQYGDVSPQLVAGPIGIALITTAGGLIVAVVLQIFYNYLLTKIDSIVGNMEDASISFLDLLIKHNIKK